MAESDTWTALKPLIQSLDPHRIENLIAAEAGMPDVEHRYGWIELKWLSRDKWPKRANTIVRIDHYTDLQREFLLKRWQMGEACWLVLQSGEEWFFWDAPAAQDVGKQTRQEMLDKATFYYKHKPSAPVACTILRTTKDGFR